MRNAGLPTHPHGNVDPEREYKLKSIVGESATEYLINWEDDEETGEKFENTWEPKDHANQEAVDDWEAQKADKKSEIYVLFVIVKRTYDLLQESNFKAVKQGAPPLVAKARYYSSKAEEAKHAATKERQTAKGHTKLISTLPQKYRV